MLITAKNITLRYNGKNILDDISLQINPGDIITIIGPNGAGKSSLIKCLLNITKPSSGSIIHSKNLDIGYVPQKIAIDSSLPILVSDFLQLNKKTNKQNLQTICDDVNISALLNKNFANLSGGEKQKVLLARSLLNNPNLLVLDEVTAGMDISTQLDFYTLIEKIWQKYNLAVLMVSHDLHMVMAKSKKVVCLFHHICCSGKPEQVVNSPEFTKLFGDSLQNTLAIYNHHHDHTHKELEYG